MAKKSTSDLEPFDIPLTGKLITSEDPLLLGEGDFRSLINMRYSDKTVRGVQGMTKINASATSYTRIDNGFQFKKDQPTESHIFAQTTTGANSRIVKSDNSTSVPAQDTLSTFLALTNNNRAYFSNAPDGAMMIMPGTENYIWGGNESRISFFENVSGSDKFDYTQQVNNTLTDAENIATIHVNAGASVVVIRTLRAIQGVKFYIGSVPNATAATVGVTYWNGTTNAAVAGLVDGTSVGGKSLAQTGTISFTSTTTTAEPLYKDSIYGFLYTFTFTGVDAGTTIYYCTCDAPVQAITNIWDGTERDILSFYKYDTAYTDNILNVYIREYVAAEPITYSQVGGLVAGQKLIMGFAERMTALNITIPDSLYVNTTAATAPTLKYYDGNAFVTAGTLVDGTNGFNQSGTISWNPPSSASEFQTTISKSDPYYYYEITFDKNLSADVRVDFIAGVPAPASLKPHRFAIEWQNRNWLFNDQVQYKNQGLASSYGTNSVFNGSDSITFDFGNDEEVVAASTIFTRFGGSLYDNLIVFKRNSMYLLDGYSSDTYRRYTVSSKIGCIAPLTVETCDTSFEISPGLTKHIIIFQSARGIEMFDGNTVTLISGDIQDRFDPSSDNYINTAYVAIFNGFYDAHNFEYHWCCATGSSTSLNEEWVYDLIRKKWYLADRGTGKALNCGFNVEDSYGNKYIYGGTTDGYIERLEYGTSFDGNSIAHTMWLHDYPLSKSMNYENCLTHLALTALSKNTSTSTVTATVYADGATSGTALPVISQANATHRYYRVVRSIRINGTTHSVKFEVSTNNETIGFEPLWFSGFFQPIRENTI